MVCLCECVKKVNYCVNESDWYVVTCLFEIKLKKKMKFVVLSWIWWMICICWYMYFVFYLFMWCLSLQNSISLIMIVSCKLFLASELYGNVGNIGCRSWVRCRTWRGYFIFFIFNTDLTRGIQTCVSLFWSLIWLTMHSLELWPNLWWGNMTILVQG